MGRRSGSRSAVTRSRSGPSRERSPLVRYPSIAGPSSDWIDEPCIAFEKFDGSNLQFHWSQSDGWHLTGTRRRTVLPDNPLFGESIGLFQRELADGILAAVRGQRDYRNTKTVVAFCEFYGRGTFSGLHDDSDEKHLRLFDVMLPGLGISQTGFVPPGDFVRHFESLDITPVVYEGAMSREFIDRVRAGELGVREGVVCKGSQTVRGRKGRAETAIWMSKVKALAWLDELARRAGDDPTLQEELETNHAEQLEL